MRQSERKITEFEIDENLKIINNPNKEIVETAETHLLIEMAPAAPEIESQKKLVRFIGTTRLAPRLQTLWMGEGDAGPDVTYMLLPSAEITDTILRSKNQTKAQSQKMLKMVIQTTKTLHKENQKKIAAATKAEEMKAQQEKDKEPEKENARKLKEIALQKKEKARRREEDRKARIVEKTRQQEMLQAAKMEAKKQAKEEKAMAVQRNNQIASSIWTQIKEKMASYLKTTQITRKTTLKTMKKPIAMKTAKKSKKLVAMQIGMKTGMKIVKTAMKVKKTKKIAMKSM